MSSVIDAESATPATLPPTLPPTIPATLPPTIPATLPPTIPATLAPTIPGDVAAGSPPPPPPPVLPAGGGWRTELPGQPSTPPRRRGRLVGLIAATALVSSALTALAIRLIDPRDEQLVVQTTSPSTGGADGQGAPAAFDTVAVVDGATPGVVAIHTTLSGTGIFDQPVTEQGAGTGFVASADGVIYTNAHVVADATEVEVTLADGTTKTGSVIGVDRTDDLAVVTIDAEGLHALPIGKSADLRVGDPVVAVGNALALPGGPTATQGIVSALNRTIDTSNGEHLALLIQTDAAINPGNSGGPLLNDRGEVVGINTAGAQQAENVGFAIALDRAAPILDELAHGKPHLKAFLGVQTETVDSTATDQSGVTVKAGAYVVGVTAESAADVAGIEVGDVITKIDDKAIAGSPDVADAMGTHKPGDKTTIVVQRGKQEKTFTVELGSHQA